MSRKHKPVVVAIGAALAGGLTLTGSAFAMQPLASGYMVAGASVAEGSCGAGMKAGEGSCGADKAAGAEGKCGMQAMDADKDGRVSRAEFSAMHKDGDAMFASHDADKDGFISAVEMKGHMEGEDGGDQPMKPAADQKAGMEGKCGEGKCGSN